MDYLDKINSTIDDFIAIRHKIHAHPELGFEEVNTSQLVADLLKMGLYRRCWYGKNRRCWHIKAWHI